MVKCKSLIINDIKEEDATNFINDIIIYYDNNDFQWSIPSKAIKYKYNFHLKNIVIDLTDVPLLLPIRYDEVIHFTIELTNNKFI
jgi:hypothetical protein